MPLLAMTITMTIEHGAAVERGDESQQQSDDHRNGETDDPEDRRVPELFFDELGHRQLLPDRAAEITVRGPFQPAQVLSRKWVVEPKLLAQLLQRAARRHRTE